MPVQTPQIEEPTFGGGIATQQSAAAATPPMASGATAQQLPAGAGFVPKSGAVAYVANSILDGWLKGRQIAAVKNMQNAQNELSSMKNIYDDQAQRWKADVLAKGADSQEAQQSRRDAVTAWNQYNSVRAKYVTPDQGQQKGKSTGQKVKSGFQNFGSQMFGKGGVTPHLFPQLAIQATKDNPPGLNMTPEDLLQAQQYQQSKTSTELGKKQLEDVTDQISVRKQKEADDEKMKSIVAKPDIDRTPAEAQWLSGYERIQHINDPEQQKMADGVLKKLQAGTPLTDVERNFAYSQRLLQGPQSIQYQDGLNTYVAMQNPDGTITGRTKLGRVYHEDAASEAARSAKLMFDLRVKENIRAGMSEKDATQAALLEESRNPAVTAQFIGDNPVESAKRTQALSKALKTVYANAGGMGADANARKLAQAVMSNFISGDPKGAGNYLLFRNQIADPTGKSGWWWDRQDQYAGGLTKDKLAATQAALWNQVRQTMQEQNPNMTPMELDQAMPEWMKAPDGTPPPGGQASAQPMSNPPGESFLGKVGDVLTWPARTAVGAAEYEFGSSGAPKNEVMAKGPDGFYGTKTKDTKEYRVHTSDGWVKYHMTEGDAQKAKSNGFEVQPMEMSKIQ